MKSPSSAIPLSSRRPACRALTPGRRAEFPLPGWPLFRLGFRPFYLGAAAFAALAVPYWVTAPFWAWRRCRRRCPAVVARPRDAVRLCGRGDRGFPADGRKGLDRLVHAARLALAVMATIWLAARLAALGAPYAMYALLDALLLPWVAGVAAGALEVGEPPQSPAGCRGRAAGVLQPRVSCGDAGMVEHRPPACAVRWPRFDRDDRVRDRRARHPGLHDVGTAGSATPDAAVAGERAALATTALSLAAWVLLPVNPITAAGFSLAALLHTSRLWHWQPWRTKARPILWVLHPHGLRLAAPGLRVARSRSNGFRVDICRHPCPCRRRHGWTHRWHDHPDRARPYRPSTQGVTAK